jgi:hypothetical protein
MSTFKQKPKKQRKKKNINANSTLDKKHREKAKEFNNSDNTLQKLKVKVNKKNDELNKLNNKDFSNFTPSDSRKKSNLKTEIEELNNQIFIIENNINEIEYFNNVIDYIIPYYDLIENNKNGNVKSKTVEIIDFFSSNTMKKEKNTNKKNKVDNSNRASIYNNYLKGIGGTGLKKRKKKKKLLQTCIYPECNNKELTLHLTDGNFVCTNCGFTVPTIMDSDRPNYKDPIPDYTAYAYKRINHFNESGKCCIKIIFNKVGVKRKRQ